jgi:hypothetical protein
MSTELTPEQLEIVEMNLVDTFVCTQDEVAATLGIKRQPDGSWSEPDAQRIFAEVERTHRQNFINMLMDDSASSSS